MDSLTYSYQAGTNKLDHINDAVKADNYTEDIDDQATGNYNYDAIGNLVKDDAGGIRSINWTVYGKIDSITKTNGTTIKYLYDAAGNRISKTVKQGAITSTTGYVRDASGNVMSVYTTADTANSGHLMQSEVDLYGSSRLGIWKPGIDVDYLTPATDTIVPLLGTGYSLTFTRGNKLFELSNHLGNVLTTLSDKKLQHTSDSATVDYYNLDVVSAGDYYPFGMGMPGRSYSSGGGYRYGFNGQEKSTEVNDNSYTAGYWEYDSRIGRRWNIEPLTNKFPWQSPYAVMDNNPILENDPTGRSGELTIDKQAKTITITSHIVFYSSEYTITSLDAMSIAQNMEKQWNSANGKVKIDGVTYKVKFKITGEYKNTLTENVKKEIDKNRDIKNNYFRVGAETDQGTSYTDKTKANTGFLELDQINGKKSTSAAHEFGHSLGLTHEKNSDGSDKTIEGQPGIMATQNNNVNDQYQENFVRKDLTTPVLKRDMRKVTQKDIDNLHLDKVKFDKNNKANIGGLTNEYHREYHS